MSLLYPLYTALSSLLALPLVPLALLYVWRSGKYGDHLAERLGRVSGRAVQRPEKGPKIWMHAVSLGEVKVAAAIIPCLKRRLPECSIVLSTFTPHGRDLARSLFQEEIPVFYAPVDLGFCVRRALAGVRPDALVFLETEIWPAWVFEAWKRGIPIGLIHGRISPRSFPSYLRWRFLFKQVLSRFHVFSMIGPQDRDRIVAMGAPRQRVKVVGNAKYDHLLANVRLETEARMRTELHIQADSYVLVAGSTREGEEDMVLKAYEEVLRPFPDTVLVIAPRHIERTPAISRLLAQRGHDVHLRTEMPKTPGKRSARAVILNTFGELFQTYSVATVVFCGASLVPLGGQNPLEPAAWGKPVLYGPSMEDFLDARDMLETSGGGMTVADAGALAQAVIGLFQDPTRLQSMGEGARKAVANHHGAAESHAEWIEKGLLLLQRT